MTLLALSQTPTEGPARLKEAGTVQPISLTAGQSLNSLINQLHAQCPTPPGWILGSLQTPAHEWLAALSLFRDARVLIADTHQDPVQWQDWLSGEIWSDTPAPAPEPESETEQEATASAPAPEPAPAPTPAAPPPKAPERPAASTGEKRTPEQMSDNELVHDAFRYAAWGNHETSLDSIRTQGALRQNRNPELPARIEKAIKQGAYALNVWRGAEKRLKDGGRTQAFEEWWNKTLNASAGNARRHLKTQLKKWETRQKTQRDKLQQARKDRALPPALQPLQLAPGQPHPNSLRHQAPASHWEILIDETGEHFEEQTQGLAHNKVGRVVALAYPANRCPLPPLPDFHATDESHRKVDEVIDRVLKAPVGVLGLTVGDRLTGVRSSWFSAIHQLIELVARLLPLSESTAPRIDVCIEQRGAFESQMPLMAVAEVLQNRLRALHPRLAQLKLSLKFIDKSGHPQNGYVDALAYTWGSPSSESRKRLRLAALKGHCLIEAQADAVERLYARLDGEAPTPAEWYPMAAIYANEPAHSLLRDTLDTLGQQVQQTPGPWQDYLEEVRQRMARKDFRLDELGGALDWLQRWQPDGLTLPPRLQLLWHSARLAHDNHHGGIHLEAASACEQLGNTLLDECAPDVCEADLRVAVTATNAYRFELAEQALARWSARDIRACGLKNWAKVLSSRGQHAAFRGDYPKALNLFAEAMGTFRRLSDTHEAKRESSQTRIYDLIARMDNPQANAAETRAAAEGVFGRSLDDAAKTLARSGHEKRYRHHTLLRLLVKGGPDLASARQAYLGEEAHWQDVEVHHPWPLIQFYRSCLLAEAGAPEKAADYLERAVLACLTDDDRPVMAYMAQCLEAAGKAMGVNMTPAASPGDAASLPPACTQALQALRDTRPGDQEALWSRLARCLPFNFH